MERNPFEDGFGGDLPTDPPPNTTKRHFKKGCLWSALVALAIIVVGSIFQPFLPFLAFWYVLFLPQYLAQQTVDLPEIRGRIVELQTGTPVAGVEIARKASQWTFPDFESHDSAPVEGAKRTAWTDGNGGFTFQPVWRVHGLQGMSWTLYKEGWMPSEATVRWDPATRSFDCSHGETADAWQRFTCRQLPWEGGVELEIRISRPTLEGVKIPVYSVAEGKHVLRDPDPAKDRDPWSVYFHRLILRAQYGTFSSTDIAEQLCRHIAAGGRIGEPAVTYLGEVSSWISNADPQAARKRALIAAATHEFCLTHPTHSVCERRGYGEGRKDTGTADGLPRPEEPLATAEQAGGAGVVATSSPTKTPEGAPGPDGREGLESSLQSARLLGKYSDSDAPELPTVGTLDGRSSHAVSLVSDRMRRRHERTAASLGDDTAYIPATTRIVVVPSGALWKRGDEPGVRDPLQRFVERGGGLIVFGQARTDDYNAVPVPAGEQLHAIGYHHNNDFPSGVFAAERHPLTSCLVEPSLVLDHGGYVESWPRTARVLLRNNLDGMPVMVVYSVGKGAVVVVTTDEDEAWNRKEAPEEVLTLFANLIAWADDPNRARPTCHVGQPCRTELRLPLRNRTGIPAVAVEFRVWDPLAPDTISHRWQQPLQLAPGAAVEVTARLDLPAALRLRPGIHQVSARILGAPPELPGATEKLPPIVIQLEPDFGQITVQGALALPVRTPDVAVGIAGFGYAGATFNDLPIRVSLRNFSQAAFSGRLVLWGANRTGAVRKDITQWPVALGPGATETHDLTLGTLWTGIAEPTVMWIKADLIDDETGRKVFTVGNWLSKKAWED